MRIIFAVLISVVFLFCAQSKEFILKSVEGKKIVIKINDDGIKIDKYPKKVIILDFFGKNCPPCKAMMPVLSSVQKKLKNKLQVIGIHVQEPLNLKEYVTLKKRKGINYPIFDYFRGNENFVDYIAQITKWRGSIPYMLFFDANGSYIGYHLGMVDKKTLEDIVKEYSKAK